VDRIVHALRATRPPLRDDVAIMVLRRMPLEGHPSRQLLTAIRVVAQGDALLSPSITRLQMRSRRSEPEAAAGRRGAATGCAFARSPVQAAAGGFASRSRMS